MARILRGDIRWADLNPTIGHEQSGLRPILIISKEIFNDGMGVVIAVALTSKQPKFGFPLALELSSSDLPKKSWALMGQVRTFSVDRIGKKLGEATQPELEQIIEGINEIIGT